MDTLREMKENEAYLLGTYYMNPLLFFAEAVALTRQEPGVSIADIAKCFKKQFDDAEIATLVYELVLALDPNDPIKDNEHYKNFATK